MKNNSVESFPLILLAGGRSSRMGVPKGLMPYQGCPWLLEQFRRFRVAGGKRVIVALGFCREDYLRHFPWLAGDAQVPASLSGLNISIAVNPHPQRGPFSSLQSAIAALKEEDHPGVFVLPIDVPGPGREVFEAMSRAFGGSLKALIPCFKSKGGHPVLLSRPFIIHLAGIAPDAMDARLDFQIRALPRNRVARIPVPDEQISMNMNRPEDFKHYLKES